MRSTFNILFYVNKSKEKNGVVPVMGRVTINGTQSYSLNDITDVLFTLLYQQMEVVAHQAIGIEHTEGRKPYPLLIIPLRLASKNGNHLHVVFLILEDVLTVNAPEHHMIESVPSAIVRA